MLRFVVALLIVATAAPALACGGSGPRRVEVHLAGLTIHAELASTAQERSQGLGGRDSMPQDAGMLFVFADARQPSFWMRGMRFPLDFVWVSGDRHIVDLTESAPPPAPGAPDAELPRYGPDGPVLYVLEVNAGVVQQAGLAAGDAVAFDPEPPVAGD